MSRQIELVMLLIVLATALPPSTVAGHSDVFLLTDAAENVIQPPPATPPRDPIESAIRFRTGAGLHAERDYVIDVAADPLSTAGDFGFPLTPDELTYLNRRLKVREDVGPLRSYLDRQEDTFAGVYFDNEGAAAEGVALKLVAEFTSDPEVHKKALESMMPVDSSVEVRKAAHTYAELNAIVDAIPNDHEWLKSLGLTVYSAGVDEVRNRVLLGISKPDERAAEALARRYGVDRVHIYVDTPPQPDACTRTACPPPWPAGLNINDPDGFHCTSGYNVQSSTGNWFMTTAGHCPDDHWYHNGTFMGATPAGKNEFRSGTHADVQAFDINQANHSNSLLTGSKTCNPCLFRVMTSRQLSSQDVVHDTTCMSGAYSGSSCGFLQVISMTYYWPDYNYYLYEQRVADYSRTPGDSGGPVFRSQKALGSHVHYQSSTGRAVYSHIAWMEYELGLHMCFSGC